MTTIHFHYTDSYNNPSRGSLAFMPHRRHAANETEVLPKPFTIPLLNGEVTVNLQPNSSSWVWIVTEYFEDVSTSFYTTVPDRDGVLEHTELIHINPSSIPAPYDAVEPAWWAEMRQYKTTVSDTLLQSGEALTEAQAAIETGHESIERTQHNASLAKAYSEQSRNYSYETKDYRDEAKTWRDEAEEQADRAATGPESAQALAEAARDETLAARDEVIPARDETLAARDETLTARDETLTARDETVETKDNMIVDGTIVEDDLVLSTVSGGIINAGNVRGPQGDPGKDGVSQLPGEWHNITTDNGWINRLSAPHPLRYRINNGNIEIIGELNATDATSPIIARIPETLPFPTYTPATIAHEPGPITTLNVNGELRINNHDNIDRININIRSPF